MTHATPGRHDARDAPLAPYQPDPPPPTRAPKTSAGPDPRNRDSLNITVINGDVAGALRLLKKRCYPVLRELRERESYRKPGERRRQKRLRAIRSTRTRAARARRHARG
jgi:ribosomal protein S21